MGVSTFTVSCSCTHSPRSIFEFATIILAGDDEDGPPRGAINLAPTPRP